MADLKQCDVCHQTAPLNHNAPSLPDGGWYRLEGSLEGPTYLKRPWWWACCLQCLHRLVLRLDNEAPVGGIGTRLMLDDEPAMTDDSPKEAPHA